jgi:hypothetical protein
MINNRFAPLPSPLALHGLGELFSETQSHHVTLLIKSFSQKGSNHHTRDSYMEHVAGVPTLISQFVRPKMKWKWLRISFES